MRKVTINQTFESIETQEKLINEALINYMKDKESIKQLCGYDWIIEGWNNCFNMQLLFWELV